MAAPGGGDFTFAPHNGVALCPARKSEKENLVPANGDKFTGQAFGSPTKVCVPARPASVRRSSYDDPNRPANRRQEAATWLEQLTGQKIDAESDGTFHAAVRDGVLLCRILHLLKPGVIPQIVLAKMTQPLEQLGSGATEFARCFVSAMSTLKVPRYAVPTVPDMEDGCADGGQRLVECLLFLKGSEEARRHDKLAHETAQRQAELLEPSTPQQLSPAALTPFQLQPLPAVATPDPVDAGLLRQCARLTTAASVESQTSPVESALAVARMLKQCTEQLRTTPTHLRSATSSSESSASPSSSLDAVSTELLMAQLGPFLGSGITTVTQRYERMIQDRDAQLKRSVRAVEARDKALAEAKQALAAAQQQVEELKRAPIRSTALQSPTGGSMSQLANELQKVRATEADIRAELASARHAVEQAAAAAADSRAVAAAAAAQCQQLQQQVQQLERIAEKYAGVVAQNTALYNEVQDLKGSIRVFCRVRPQGATGDPSPTCTNVGVDGELAIDVRGQQRAFTFDRVYGGGATQAQVYEDTKPLIRSVLDGYNVAVFAYGQTGSGKTHTMSGSDAEHMEGRGINYRALDDLFAINVQRTGEVEHSIKVQLLEIYNEQVRDLLVDTPRRLDIRSTAASGLNVPDASQVPVSSTADVLAVMAKGARNRSVADTKMNERSSRSHSVLTVIVDGRSHLSGSTTHGCLHLIDLAGSERVRRSEATGERLKEAQHINRSLSALGSVMAALASGAPHVPFRDSKLTALLQDSLSGNAKAMMFIHVAPEASSVGESISTLSFGSRVSDITLGRATRNCESAAIFEARQAAQQAEQRAAAAAAEAEQLRHALAAQQAATAMLQDELSQLRLLRQHQAAQPAPRAALPASECSSSRTSSGGGGSHISGSPPLVCVGSACQEVAPSSSQPAPSAGLPPRSPRSGTTALQLPPTSRAAMPSRGGAGTPRSNSETRRRSAAALQSRRSSSSSRSSEDSCCTVNGPMAAGADHAAMQSPRNPLAGRSLRLDTAAADDRGGSGCMTPRSSRSGSTQVAPDMGRRLSLPATPCTPRTMASRIPRLSLSGISGGSTTPRGERPASARSPHTRGGSQDPARTSGAMTERARPAAERTVPASTVGVRRPLASRQAGEGRTWLAAQEAAGPRASARRTARPSMGPAEKPAASRGPVPKRWN